jgi:hypothetical protein
MASETHQTLLVIGNLIADEAKTASRAENDIAAASSPFNAAIEKMAKKDVLVMTNYWNKSSVTEADQSTYHSTGKLPDKVESFITDLEFSMVGNTTGVCIESQLAAGLGLPPSKFLIFVLNFLR